MIAPQKHNRTSVHWCDCKTPIRMSVHGFFLSLVCARDWSVSIMTHNMSPVKSHAFHLTPLYITSQILSTAQGPLGAEVR